MITVQTSIPLQLSCSIELQIHNASVSLLVSKNLLHFDSDPRTNQKSFLCHTSCFDHNMFKCPSHTSSI